MPCRFKAGLRWILRVSHDQNFKNLILDYPRAALEFFAFEEAATIPATARITPVRQEQLQDRLGEHFRELDTPLLVEFPEGEREAVLFLLEEETTTQQFSIHRLARYCLDIAELLDTERVVPVVIFLRPGRYPRSLDLGTTRNTYLSFWFIISDLGTIPAREYLHSRNIVARMNLPNMRQDPEQRVEIYLRAQEGLAQLEPDPNKRIKYIDFIARYANLTEEEQAQYKQYLQQSSYKEVIHGTGTAGTGRRHSTRLPGWDSAGYPARCRTQIRSRRFGADAGYPQNSRYRSLEHHPQRLEIRGQHPPATAYVS
uniref:Transposase, YhgA-like n=1 Tax=Candidatus Kentrum sp. LFY TaxID=2126342 RepID=A0A450UMW1_9GAMM|nr:MAG: Putative transposase, YhgA-like [Candidatus Kentron sp. LFY]